MYSAAADPARWRPKQFLLLLCLALALAGCRRVDPVIKIGLVAPFEGGQRAVGYDVIYSARLAVRQANQGEGLNGYRVGLVALDDGGDAELARQAAASLAADPAVVAVIGHWGPATTAAAAPVYAAAGLPFLDSRQERFAPVDPAGLSRDFRDAYAAVTPFDEQAGPYAGPAYEGAGLLLEAVAQVTAAGEVPDRANLMAALENLADRGITRDTIQR